MPRGGRRPGAGAPKGNLNALKHGRRSAQFAMLGAILASNPKVRDNLLALARRHELRQDRADEIASDLLTRLLQHARDIARGKPSRGPFQHFLRPPGDDLTAWRAQLDALARQEALRSNVQSDDAERRTISQGGLQTGPATGELFEITENPAPDNQTPTVNLPKNQSSDTKVDPKIND